jgi:2,3-bisphosphoglycerate-independent phosphoglycerate mutase
LLIDLLQLTNELSEVLYNVLIEHPINKERIKVGKNPINCVLLRGCGSCIDVSSKGELYTAIMALKKL